MMQNKKPSFLLEEELTYKLRGIFIDISKEHGCLYKEKAYHKFLADKFKEKKVNFISKPRLLIRNPDTGEIVDYHYPDFVVEDKIIVEIKSQNQIFNNHINQLIRYLASTEYEVGFIVNFGTPKAGIERRVFTNDRKPFLH